MDIRVKRRYYKSSKKGRAGSFRARQPKGVGTTVHATIMLDPSLKQDKRKRERVIKHERDEIKAWGKGRLRPHRVARRKETGKRKHRQYSL